MAVESSRTVDAGPMERLEIPVEQIVSGGNVRSDLGDLSWLQALIAEHGILVPIGVRAVGENQYAIDYGFRRFACALRLGLRTVPAVLVPKGVGTLLVNMVENFARKDLNPLEEAEGYHQLALQYALSAEDVGVMLARSGRHVRDRLELLSAHPDLHAAIAAGEIGASVATELARLPRDEQPRWLARGKRVSHRAIKQDVDFALMPPEERDRMGAEALARRAGNDPQPELPIVQEPAEDPRLRMAVEYGRRALDNVLAIQGVWMQLPPTLQAEVLGVLGSVRVQIGALVPHAEPAHANVQDG